MNEVALKIIWKMLGSTIQSLVSSLPLTSSFLTMPWKSWWMPTCLRNSTAHDAVWVHLFGASKWIWGYWPIILTSICFIRKSENNNGDNFAALIFSYFLTDAFDDLTEASIAYPLFFLRGVACVLRSMDQDLTVKTFILFPLRLKIMKSLQIFLFFGSKTANSSCKTIQKDPGLFWMGSICT